MSKPDIQVVIVDDSRGEKCEASCGVEWSSVEAITLANQRTKDRFGDRAQLEYIDLSQPTPSHRALELKPRIKDLSLPLLVIDGEPRISGQFDIRRLLDAIEAEVEIKL